MEKVSTISTLTTRRPKWQYPQPQPTPRILHLPRRPRKRVTSKGKPAPERKGKLETLFGQEREFSRGVMMPIVMVSGGDGGECNEEGRRERVEERECNLMVEEEKWRFQAEMLRAECNLLRMEREIALKKMERRRVHMERTLRSAVHTLLSGRRKICDGKDARLVLEEDIGELVEKLEKLQRRSRTKDLEVHKCNNFDKQSLLLQRQLQKFGGESNEIYVKEIQEMAEASLSIKSTCSVDEKFASNRSFNVELLRRKIEGLSKETLLERMEDEYGSMLSTANTSATSSASTSKRLDPDISSSSSRQPWKDTKHQEAAKCSGHCKAIVRRVVEQVRAETEQWSQMQEMLGQVRDEMKELQSSREFWEDRALQSDYQIQSLHSAVQEWKQKARCFEEKANELETQVLVLNAEIEMLKKRRGTKTGSGIDSSLFLAHNSPNEMEKRVLVCRLKENICPSQDFGNQKEELGYGRRKLRTSTNGVSSPKRLPFRDIGNSSPLLRQNSRAIFQEKL